VTRFANPEPIAGWIVVIVAGVALLIDLGTAALTYAQSKDSMNIRAAFLHNVADALGSVGVIIAGTLMLMYDWWIVDPIVTLAIALYILWHAFAEIGEAIRMLMLGVPSGIDLKGLVTEMKRSKGVQNVHHVHLWAIDEKRTALEAHVVVADDCGRDSDAIRERLCAMLSERAGIDHVTLQFEHASAACGPEASTIGHGVPAE
jgi:cobalt-zinc-cadmium efflux system protein